MTAKEYLRSEHCVAKCPDELIEWMEGYAKKAFEAGLKTRNYTPSKEYVDNEFKKWKEKQQ